MADLLRQDEVVAANDTQPPAMVDVDHWGERQDFARLCTSISMACLVWLVVAAAAFALMSR